MKEDLMHLLKYYVYAALIIFIVNEGSMLHNGFIILLIDNLTKSCNPCTAVMGPSIHVCCIYKAISK